MKRILNLRLYGGDYTIDFPTFLEKETQKKPADKCPANSLK